ncbi:hydratase [uncultured Paraglaciecola sp.]|uniref:hydratase n=1 Tax=uncultured Paraglaciecola sp. TaxID=1765024 RepID=UPI00259A852B|nr:hydratase [uncultured Paraglaciecola sp.]
MNSFETAAKELLSRRKAGTKAPCLDESIRPTSNDEALAIQGEMAKLHKVKGWKCLLPPAEGKIVVAPIFDVQQDTNTIELYADNGVARVEPEIGFVLARPLGPNSSGYTDTEIIDAIGSTHMALELIQSRYADDSDKEFADSLADCMVNQGMFVGPEVDKATAIELSTVQLSVTQKGGTQVLYGKHPNPRAIDGLVWLINYMTKRGVSFEAGEVIITGSFKGVLDMAFDVETTIAYQDLAEYTVTFKALV